MVLIYKKLLKIKSSNIFDVGTGYGTRIKEIVDKLNLGNKNIKYIKEKNFEINKSIANNDKLLKKLNLKNLKN